MKRTASILTKLALGVTVAAGVAACNQNKTDKNAAATTTSSAPAEASSDKAAIVYVNSDTLLNKYDYFKDMSKRLETKGKAAQSDLQSKGVAYQREIADYQKNAQTMSADQRQSTEQRLARKQQELQAYSQNANAAFQNESASEHQKLYDKVADFVQQYAKEKGYKMVLTYSKANPTVLYGDPSLDITADVAKRLNDAYSKEKK